VILGIGVDLMEVARMERALSRWGEKMAHRLFHAAEREECARRLRPGECLSATFAAKEAFLKALGTGLARGIQWQDVELVRKRGAAPTLRVTGRARVILDEWGATRTWVSVSHQGGFSVAVVVIEGEGRQE